MKTLYPGSRFIFALCFSLLALAGGAAAQSAAEIEQLFPSRIVAVSPVLTKQPAESGEKSAPVLAAKPLSRQAAARNPKIYSGSDLMQIAAQVARKYNIPENLFFSLIRQESRWHINATSYKGAKGLAQLMPATATRFGLIVNYTVDERVIPERNLEAGGRYFRFLLDTFGNNYALALAGYNAGEGAVIKYNYQIPPYSETRNYVAIICGSAFGSVEPCLRSGTGDILSGLSRTGGSSFVKKSRAISPAAATVAVEPKPAPKVAVKPLRINTSGFQSKTSGMPASESSVKSETVAQSVPQ